MAVSKKITIQHPSSHPSSGGKAPVAVEEIDETPPASEKTSEKFSEKKRVCFFCQSERSSSATQSKKTPSYTDLATLKRYINERGKIVPRAKTGVCSKHQRGVTKGIKYARHLALLPFTPKV